ncbi:MAG TPA: sensor histidine kinase [Micropepsaceae bacterium]|nr:sensor histidine kinase [Micropepsaceae bacterium]
MPIVPLFADLENLQKADQDAFESEVAARFGLVPNFFRSAPDAPFVVRQLWLFAKAAYLDTPIPTLFKERLFVYLSRFCEVRYCITRHCGFLLGLGRSAGDPNAQAMTITQVIRLLQRPVPTEENTRSALTRLEAVGEPIDWPSAETSHDEDLFTLSTVLFLQPARAGGAKRALRTALGGEKFELLMGLLTFIRSAHYWTLMHPELALEDDLKDLLHQHEELARLLSEDAEAGHCEMGTRLFEELEALRDLNERQELEKARRALEQKDRQKALMLKEVDHRIKNSLQIVASLLHLQANIAGPVASQFRNAAGRVAAIAAVHQQLHKSDYVGTVQLDQYLTDLCQGIAIASGSPDRAWSLVVDAAPLTISNDIAVPLALIVNELLTNAIQHSKPVGESRTLNVVVSSQPDDFSVSVSDPGAGPDPARTAGLGTRLIGSLVGQINATIARQSLAGRYTVTVTVPHRRSSLVTDHSREVH